MLQTIRGRFSVLLVAAFLCAAVSLQAEPLKTADLQIQGMSLAVATEHATVQLGTSAVIQTKFGGKTNSDAPTIDGARVLGDLVGPGITSSIEFTTAPGYAFNVASLTSEGVYYLQNIRLVDRAGNLLQVAVPSFATIEVTNAFKTTVKVTQLTPEQLRARGITVDPSNYDVYGNVVEAAEPGRPATTVDRDGAGQATNLKEPDSATTHFKHDAALALKQYLDPDQEGTTSDNDYLGRPLTRRYPDGTTEKFVWEGSRLKEYKDRQERRQQFGYNPKGQLESIRNFAGDELDHITYDDGGRITKWTNQDSEIEYLDFDMENRPWRTRQTRFVPGTGPVSPQVLDSFEQRHEWNIHGERVSWQMPRPANFTAPGWTDKVFEGHDAAGNISAISRTYFGGVVTPMPLVSAVFRNAGRPDVRTLTTSCEAGVACNTAQIERKYDYNASTGQLNEMRVRSQGITVAGSHVDYGNTLQIKDLQLLGVSSDERYAHFAYDNRSRLSEFVYGTTFGGAAGEAPGGAKVQQTPAGFMSDVTRKSTFDDATRTALAQRNVDTSKLDPPSSHATEVPGHKLDTFTKGGTTQSFTYEGGVRKSDGRFVYKWDEKSRLRSVTEIPTSTGVKVRRINYYYDGNDRMIGRFAQYATPTTVSPDSSVLDTFAWVAEDRPGVLAADGLPSDTTFTWDPVSDDLVAIWKAGATPSDPNGGLLKQILHGGLQYDDPLEVTFPNPNAPGKLARLYPVFDEAGTAAMQVVLNANGEVVARNVPNDAFGGENASLGGSAVDRIQVKATKNDQGALTGVEISVRTTDAIRTDSVAGGLRIAALDGSGNAVATSNATPELADAYTARVSLTAAQWTALTSATSSTTLSIGVRSTLRAAAWGNAPILEAPEWVRATKPVFSSAELPVEFRESLPSLTQWIAGVGTSDTRKLYEVENLSLLAVASGSSEDAVDEVVASRFQAMPFMEPLTELTCVRARWYDSRVGAFLAPDPEGYWDSSDLYRFCGSDFINCSDPSGEFGWSDVQRFGAGWIRGKVQNAVERVVAVAGSAAAPLTKAGEAIIENYTNLQIAVSAYRANGVKGVADSATLLNDWKRADERKTLSALGSAIPGVREVRHGRDFGEAIAAGRYENAGAALARGQEAANEDAATLLSLSALSRGLYARTVSLFDFDSVAMAGMRGLTEGLVETRQLMAPRIYPRLPLDPLPQGAGAYQLRLFPAEPYNRYGMYGSTPTRAMNEWVPEGLSFDHDPSLVRHYWEGPGGGRLPGYNLLPEERLAYGRDLAQGKLVPAPQDAQGAVEAAYSKRKNKALGFKRSK